MICMVTGKQEVNRSSLVDSEVWEQEVERFHVVTKETNEQEVMRLGCLPPISPSER